MNTPPNTELFDTADELARAAAERVIGLLARSCLDRKAICLAGGSTPERLYRLLAHHSEAARISWPNLHLFWGDERLVPPDARDSNARMTLDALGAAPIPLDNIHPIPTTGLTVEASAAAYERELKSFFGASTLDDARPIFDVVLLGLGEDGHTGSLFPGQPQVDERQRWVVGVPQAGQPPAVPRVSLTIPALSSSREALFLVSGKGKRDAFAAMARGDDRPAGRIRSAGRVRWLVTRDVVS